MIYLITFGVLGVVAAGGVAAYYRAMGEHGHDAPRRARLPRAWGTWARRHAQAVRRRARTTRSNAPAPPDDPEPNVCPDCGSPPDGLCGAPSRDYCRWMPPEPTRKATAAERDWWLTLAEQAAADAGLSRLKVFIEACTPQDMAGEIAATRPWNDDTGSFTAYIDAGEPA